MVLPFAPTGCRLVTEIASALNVIIKTLLAVIRTWL
jgi:hypothetical protein